jgi:hypothetical protein
MEAMRPRGRHRVVEPPGAATAFQPRRRAGADGLSATANLSPGAGDLSGVSDRATITASIVHGPAVPVTMDMMADPSL